MTFPDAYTKAQIEALCHRYEAACNLSFTTGADVVITEDEAVVLRGQGYRWDDGAVVVTPRAEVEAIPSSHTKCDHCDGRGADFIYEGHRLCCECMSAFTSWILDGGMVEAPDMFASFLDARSEVAR